MSTDKREREIMHDGVSVARMRISLPVCEPDSRMAAFYTMLADRAEGWFEEKLAPEAVADYESSEDERKKWRYRPTVFCINTSVGGDEKKCICRMEVICTHSGKEAYRLLRFHVWNKKRCRLIPCFMNKRAIK